MNISWNFPSDPLLECSHFIISTNASALSSTANSSVLITRPVHDPADAIYTVSVAAMDKAGRTGVQSEPRCFSFESEYKAVYSCNILYVFLLNIAPRVLEVHSDKAHGNTITIKWTVEVCM